MLSKLVKYLQKLTKDRVFHKSVLHFAVFFAAVTAFTLLTTDHVITHQPQPMLPTEYSTIPANTMSKVDLEQNLRSKSANVQGLIFFKGLNSIVVLGNGLEHDQLVLNADVDEMRELAVADKLLVIDKNSDLDTSATSILSLWWYVGVFGLISWLYRLLFFKREKGKVYSRARIFLTTIPDVMTEIVKASKLKPSRFYLTVLIALVAVNALAFGLRLYHNNNLYVVPTEIASATRIQPWQISRHLEQHPEEFQRVSIVPELNTAYVVLNSRTVPVGAPQPAAANEAPTDSSATGSPDFPGTPVAAATKDGGQQALAPTPAAVAVGGHKPVLVDRTVEFTNSAAGKADFAAFVAIIHAKKIESKNVPAVHELGYVDSLTTSGKIIGGFLLLMALMLGAYIFSQWSYWLGKEKPLMPGEIYVDPKLVGAGGSTVSGGSAVVTREEDRKTFADVAGCQEAIDELQVVKKKIMRPRLYRIFGAPVPSGVILYGPPGTGKTLLARALAGEVGGSFQALSGSEFVEMYVGVGAKRVREAYTKARTDARKTGRISIVFIDEFDALAKKRGANSDGGNREYEQTLNQLLVEMNGFGNHGQVLTMAATNRLDILDEAVLRPGRFDIKVKVPKPDRKGRALIYGIYLKKLKLVLSGEAEEREGSFLKLLDDLARRSHDFSGAEIEGAIKDGATIAVERQFGDVLEDITEEQENEYRERAIITDKDLHLGIDKMSYGTQIKSRVRTDKERKATAIHEIGHASVPTEMRGDPVNRITIVMTDKSLGLMDSSPEEGERYDWTDEQFTIRLRMMLAGRAAEKVILSKISTGASNDFERASQLARQMVGVYGMSKEFGNKSIPLDQHGFPASNIGETMLKQFNDAWGGIIDTAQADTEAFIAAHRTQVEHAANALYDEETLTGDEFRRLWAEAKSKVEEAETTANNEAAPAPQTEGGDNAQQ
jgi:cell division protease FtsH